MTLSIYETSFITVIGEITSETFQRYTDQLKDHNRYPTSPLVISSPGGDIGYMLAMLDEIDESKRTTYATGICQSAAAVLATAGEGKRIATMDALFRFIAPEPSGAEEEVSDLRWFLHSMVVARLAARLGSARIEIQDLFDGQFISSIRAKELGLIDEVISTEVTDAGNTDRLSGSEGEVNGHTFHTS